MSSGSWRARVAGILVALYALCVMAPAIALALADDVASAHCLNAVTAQAAPAAHVHGHVHGASHAHADHDHADHAAPSHHTDGSDKPHMGACCGLFCLAGLPTEFGPVIEQTVHASTEIRPGEDHLIGRGPDRINRPPITLLSL